MFSTENEKYTLGYVYPIHTDCFDTVWHRQTSRLKTTYKAQKQDILETAFKS